MPHEVATKSPAACKISVRTTRGSWSGSGTLAGYDTLNGVEGGWVVTNHHVMLGPGNKGTFKFHMPDGTDKSFQGTTHVAAYSNKYQVDWSVCFVPGLVASSGIKPVKFSKDRPQGRKFENTGSPRGVWPLTSDDCTLKDIIQGGRVYRWLPNSISGSSGSSLRSVMNNGHGEILLTWSYGGRPATGAGQASYHIWISQKTKSSEVGFLRVPGLVEVADEDDLPVKDRGIQEGFFSAPEETATVQELPIWVGDIDPGDDPDDDTPETPPTVSGVPVDLEIENTKAEIKQKQAHLAKLYKIPADGSTKPPPEDDDDCNDAPTFGL